MWGISWPNLLMFMASIPDYSEENLEPGKDEENTIDVENWQKYVNR